MPRTRIALALAAAAVLIWTPAPASAGKPPAPTFTIVSLNDGLENFTDLAFRVTRTGSLKKAASVTFRTLTAGTATAGSDFTAVEFVLSIPKNTASREVGLALLNDDVGEPTETLVVGIANPSAGTIAGGSAQTSIDDDDGPGVWTVAPGESLFVANGAIGACNHVVGWIVDSAGGVLTRLGSAVDCVTNPFSGEWANTSLVAVDVRLGLFDGQCGAGHWYYSDGHGSPFDVDHAAVYPHSTVTAVAINDSGGDCSTYNVSSNPFAGNSGNLVADVWVGPTPA